LEQIVGAHGVEEGAKMGFARVDALPKRIAV
jgi:hypothetical protein